MKLKQTIADIYLQIKSIPIPVSISLVSGILMYGISFLSGGEINKNLKASLSELNTFPLEMPNVKYGLLLDTLNVDNAIIKPNQFLVDILKKYNVTENTVSNIISKASKVFDLTSLRAGKSYTMLCKKNTQNPYFFIYEPDVYSYLVLDMRDSLKAYKVVKPTQTNIKSAVGVVTNTLSDAMAQSGLSYDLIDKMEDALAWTVDFYHVQKGDSYKVLYDENSIAGKPVGVGKMYGAYFQQSGKEYYAIYYKNGNKEGYYDQDGRPMKRFFLKSPVKFSRISSGYSLHRFHPILKYTKPHFGTDYAAPAGTPIFTVGNGTVIEATRNAFNGNYVKVKHDNTYTTQYLHMSRIAKGMHRGAHVQQGQVIGYVGSTGLATGPHCCFRFWKNGKQVNPLRERNPQNPPMNKSELPAFFKIRDEVVAKLNKIPAAKAIAYNTSTDSLP